MVLALLTNFAISVYYDKHKNLGLASSIDDIDSSTDNGSSVFL